MVLGQHDLDQHNCETNRYGKYSITVSTLESWNKTKNN